MIHCLDAGRLPAASGGKIPFPIRLPIPFVEAKITMHPWDEKEALSYTQNKIRSKRSRIKTKRGQKVRKPVC